MKGFGLLLLCLGLTSLSVQAEDAYYNNQEGLKIAACLQDQIKNAPAPSIKSLKIGKEWNCKQLMFFWDDQQHMNILIVRDDYGAPIFKFTETPYTRTDGIVNNATPTSKDKETYGYFSHEFQTGFFSHVAPGMAPHRQDYLTFTKSGYLLWEESVANAPYHLEHFPGLMERPFAVYGNYPETPEEYKYRVNTYGVCYEKAAPPAEAAPCF